MSPERKWRWRIDRSGWRDGNMRDQKVELGYSGTPSNSIEILEGDLSFYPGRTPTLS